MNANPKRSPQKGEVRVKEKTMKIQGVHEGREVKNFAVLALFRTGSRRKGRNGLNSLMIQALL